MRLIIFLITILAASFLAGPAVARTTEKKIMFNDLYIKYGRLFGVDWRLIKAIAMKESSESADAVNLADPSVGVMQVLAKGWPNDVTNSFPAVSNWPPNDPKDLLNPEYNISVGVQILAWNLKNYGSPRGIAVYNSWSQRVKPVNGPFENQDYVNKVLKFYEQNKKDYPK